MALIQISEISWFVTQMDDHKYPEYLIANWDILFIYCLPQKPPY